MSEFFHVAFINITVFLIIIIIIITTTIPKGLGAQLETIGIQLSVELHVV